MELFKNAKAVRLMSAHGKYLTASSNEETVTQDINQSSEAANWAVELVANSDSLIRLKSCYGKYLLASYQPFLLGVTGSKVLQTLPDQFDGSVDWEPTMDNNGAVKLRSRNGQFLRANAGMPPWRNSVTHNIPYRTTSQEWILWEVQIVVYSPDANPPSSLTIGNEESDLSSKVSAMDLFKKAKAVRLKSVHGKYLIADEDEETVTQDRTGSSHSAKWTVEFVANSDSVIRLKSCYGKYLTASDQPFLLGMTGHKVVQSFPLGLDRSVEWEPIRDPSHSAVKLKTRNGQFLRANGGMPPWRNSVTHNIPYRAMTQEWILWEVDVIEIMAAHLPDLE